MPEFSMESLLSGDFMNDFEKFLLDQFVFRDGFRSLKVFAENSFFNKSDVNDIYKWNDYLLKRQVYNGDDKLVQMARYIESIKERYLKDQKIYLSLIHDKGY